MGENTSRQKRKETDALVWGESAEVQMSIMEGGNLQAKKKVLKTLEEKQRFHFKTQKETARKGGAACDLNFKEGNVSTRKKDGRRRSKKSQKV